MVESKTKKVSYFVAFIIPCLILYLIFFITPFGRGIGISLTNWDGLTPKTPISLEKTEFESKILNSPKLSQKQKDFLSSVYEYSSQDNCYHRTQLKGSKRSKVEKIVKKTGYQPEKYKFVGFENYKKIFSGGASEDFYPRVVTLSKFTKTSDLPMAISKKEFEKEICKKLSKESEEYKLLNLTYEFNAKSNKYKITSRYDEFEVSDALWYLKEVDELKTIPESEIDLLIKDLKTSAFTQDYLIGRERVKEFIKKYKVSEESENIIYDSCNAYYRIAKVKMILSNVWVVKNFNMGVIGFTLFFAFFSVIGINILAFALALALDTGIRGQKVLRTVFFLPNVLSMIIVALIWSMIFVQLLPSITGVEKWISDSQKTPWLLVLVAVWQGCGYYMIIYLAGLQNIPTDIIEAAKIDGATGWQRFKSITLPMMIPSLTISLFMTIANALKSFDLIYAMIGQTGYATGTVPFVMDIYFDAFSLKQAGMATAKAMVLFFVIVLITGIQLFIMKRKEIEA